MIKVLKQIALFEADEVDDLLYESGAKKDRARRKTTSTSTSEITTSSKVQVASKFGWRAIICDLEESRLGAYQHAVMILQPFHFFLLLQQVFI